MKNRKLTNLVVKFQKFKKNNIIQRSPLVFFIIYTQNTLFSQ